MIAWSAVRAYAFVTLAAPFVVLAASLVVVAGWLAYLKILSFSDPLKLLPGAETGGLQQATEGDVEQWARKFANAAHGGKAPLNLKLPGLFPFEGRLRLVTMDPMVILHMMNSSSFEKPSPSRAFLDKLLGQGVFSAEGQAHRTLRKAYIPAFSKSVLRVLEPVMVQKAEQLCDIWSRAQDGRVDALSTLNRAALDVIAAVGFGEDINAVADSNNVFILAYRQMLNDIEYGRCMFKFYLSLHAAWIHRLFPDQLSRSFDAAHTRILEAGRSLLHLETHVRSEKDEEITSPSLLHSIIRECHGSGKISDDELLGHLSTFLFNGADSTGNTIAWALHHLSIDQAYQSRLRDELAGMPCDADRLRTLESSQLLTHLVLETLRFVPPLKSTMRVACKDEVLRTSEDILLPDGSLTRQFVVKRGTLIHASIEPINTHTDFWGPDAKTFNPDRWNDLPSTAKALPGIHSTMAFTVGPHACPASGIALAELRVFIAAIVQRFELHPAEDIGRMNAFMLRPYVRGKWVKEGVQLPLLLKPISQC